MNRLIAALLFAACAAAVMPAAAADAARGKELYATCAACHGPEASGNPALQSPALAGLDAAYLERQLRHFRSGIRGADARDAAGAQMRATVAVLGDDAALADVAAWLATLPPALVSTPVAGADLRNGSNFYQGKCGACHGGRAEGNVSLNAPRLAGQHTDYLRRQFQHFLQGVRGAHADDRFGRQMKLMAATLPGEKDVEDVLGFIAAQGAAP